MLFLLINTFLVIVLLHFLMCLKNKKRIDMIKDIPGPKTVPFFGNAFVYINKKPEDVPNFIIDYTKKYGSLFRVWVGSNLAIFSSDPCDIESVIGASKNLTKNSLYNFLQPWLGSGLLLSTGEQWFHQRRVITPAFHFKILEEFIDTFDKKTNILIKRLEKQAKNTGFNVHPYITLCALDILSETAMGIDINAQTDTECAYAKAVADMTTVLATRFIKVYQRIDFIFNLTKNKKIQDKAIKTMHEFTDNIITKRRAELLRSQNENINMENESNENDIGAKKKLALLDILLQSKVNDLPLTNKEIRQQVDTFMFAGHDTTTSAMAFTLYSISRHPDVQTRLYEEIIEVFGDTKDIKITYNDLSKLKYMECVIKESMRLYPAVPIIGRRITEEININGKLIPANTNYTIGIFIMNRNPKYFKDPEKFIPERFEIDNERYTESSHPFAYIPFSAGPRNCIGQKFAMLEMKSTILKVLANFELLPLGEEPILIMEVVLRSKNGINIGIKSRK